MFQFWKSQTSNPAHAIDGTCVDQDGCGVSSLWMRAVGERDARTGRDAPAAPAGGARKRSRRGCGLTLTLILMATSAATQQAVSVPSGQAVSLNEVLLDDATGETWVRFRFVAPAIARDGGSVDYDVAAGDIEHLCRDMVIPYMSEFELAFTHVVISMADRDVPFGEANPNATQFFEAYRLEDADCIWEAY